MKHTWVALLQLLQICLLAVSGCGGTEAGNPPSGPKQKPPGSRTDPVGRDNGTPRADEPVEEPTDQSTKPPSEVVISQPQPIPTPVNSGEVAENRLPPENSAADCPVNEGFAPDLGMLPYCEVETEIRHGQSASISLGHSDSGTSSKIWVANVSPTKTTYERRTSVEPIATTYTFVYQGKSDAEHCKFTVTYSDQEIAQNAVKAVTVKGLKGNDEHSNIQVE